MKKILSLMTFVAILFVASATQAAPRISVDITGTWLNSKDNTIHLYTTVTNRGDQNMLNKKLNVKFLRIYNAKGKSLLSCGNFSLEPAEPFVVKAGYHVDNVEWVIHGNKVPNYSGNTQTDFDASVTGSIVD